MTPPANSRNRRRESCGDEQTAGSVARACRESLRSSSETITSKTLLEFGRDLACDLGLGTFIERESSNYVDGHYLVAKCLAVEVKLSLTDDDDLADYQFHLCMDADGYWIDKGDAIEGVADLLARNARSPGDFVVRRLFSLIPRRFDLPNVAIHLEINSSVFYLQ